MRVQVVDTGIEVSPVVSTTAVAWDCPNGEGLGVWW